MSFLANINKTGVHPDLLGAIMAAHVGLADADRCDPDVRASCIIELLNERGFKGRQIFELAVVIELRLTALARLTLANAVCGFAYPSHEAGMRKVDVDLVRCAAEEPLVNQDDKPAFDVNSFQQRLLAITATRGQA